MIHLLNGLGTVSGWARRAVGRPDVILPPGANGNVLPIEFGLGGGLQTFDASGFFAGEDLTYSLSGTNHAVIDSQTGVITCPADTLESAEITVSASNVSGSMDAETLLTVRDKTLRAMDFATPASLQKFATSDPAVAIVHVAPGDDFVNPGTGISYPCIAPDVDDTDYSVLVDVGRRMISPDFGAGSGFIVGYQTAKLSAHKYVYTQITQRAGQPLRIGGVWATRTAGAQGKLRIGTKPGSRDIGEITVSMSNDGHVKKLDIPAPSSDQPVYISLRILLNEFHFEGLQFLWVESLDGSDVTDFVDQSSDAGYVLPGDAATYYIAPETGDDTNDGLSAESPKATAPLNGAPAGSTILFKGGEVYRAGNIQIGASGTEANPLVYDFTGETFGTGPAIVDNGASFGTWVEEGNNLWSAAWPNGFDIDTLRPFQDDVGLYPGQLPLPSDLAQPNDDNDYAIAETMDGTTATVTAKVFFETNFADPTTLVGARAKVWVSGNHIYKFDIIAYDAATGKITLDRPFTPNGNGDRFAIYNHPDCITVPGQFYRRGSDNTILARPLEDADPGMVNINYPGNAALLTASGDFVQIRGGIFRKSSASVPFQLSGSNCTVERSILELCQPTGATNYNLHLKKTIRARLTGVTVRNCSSGFGIFEDSGIDSLIHDCTVDRVAGTLLKMVGSNRTAVVGNKLKRAFGAHVNGLSAYGHCKDCLIIGNEINGSIPSLTLQNTLGGMVIVGNTFIGDTDGLVVGFWPNSGSFIYEIGEVTFANNVLLDRGGSGKAFALNTRKLQADSLYLNNILDGNGPKTDLRFDARQSIMQDVWEVVSAGTGHVKGDRLFAAGGSGEIAEIGLDLNDFSKPSGIKVYNAGAYDTLPPDLGRVEFSGPNTTSPLVISTTSKSAYAELVTKNVRTSKRSGVGPNDSEIEALGDILATAERETMFVDITDADQQNWDVRPSGSYDLSGGYTHTITISHPLLPKAPASLTFDWQGRYRMDGTEAADYAGWM